MNRRSAIAALLALPEVARISATEVKPDDLIVIEAPGPISDRAAARIKEIVEHNLPGRKVMVLGDGLKVKIIEKAQR